MPAEELAALRSTSTALSGLKQRQQQTAECSCSQLVRHERPVAAAVTPTRRAAFSWLRAEVACNVTCSRAASARLPVWNSVTVLTLTRPSVARGRRQLL